MSDETLCIFPHDDEPQQRLPGMFVCRKHRSHMTNLTEEVAALIVDCCRVLDGGAPTEQTPKTRRLKAAEAPAPGDLGLLSLLDKRTWIAPVKPTTLGDWDTSEPVLPVLAVIASWLLMLSEERPLTAPLPKSVLAQLVLLERHHDWLAAHPAIDDYIRELTEVRQHLRDAVSDHTHRKVTTCDLPTDEGQHPAVIIRRNRALRIVLICGGAVLVRNGDDVWRCNRCGGTWITDQQKARFGVRAA